MNDPLLPTLADTVDWLRGEGVQFALVGGIAASLRGQPRVTADVDFVLAADVERGLALASNLSTTRFKPVFEPIEQVVETSFILPVRHRTTGIKVDCSLGLTGFEQQMIARAEQWPMADRIVPVAKVEDLILTKVLAGRPQDNQDVEGMLIAQGDRLAAFATPNC